MQTVAETSLFIKQSETLFSASEKRAIIDYIAAHAEHGDIIRGTGGVRKLRVPASGRGKSGGARVILYLLDDDAPIYALLVYSKNKRVDLTADEKKKVAALSKAIKAQHRS